MSTGLGVGEQPELAALHNHAGGSFDVNDAFGKTHTTNGKKLRDFLKANSLQTHNKPCSQHCEQLLPLRFAEYGFLARCGPVSFRSGSGV
jgi:hypothetical protein